VVPILLTWGTVDAFLGNTGSPTLAAYRPCPVCASVRWQTVLPFRDFQFYSDSKVAPKRHGFDVCQCSECLALFTNPAFTPFGFQILFEEAGQSYGSSPGRFDEQIRWMSERGLLEGGTTLMDVGCSDGGFVLKLPDTVRRIGVDIDQPSIDRALAARGKANAEFFTADFERFELGRDIDVITMFHVLEHLPSPRGVLDHLASVSTPETRLLVEVPILEGGSTKDINGFFSVHHLTHFSRGSLENLLDASGWHIVDAQVQPDYNGYRVIAVPGPRLGTRLEAADDRQLLYRYLSDWYRALEDIEARLVTLDAPASVVIWGGGIHLEFLYQFTSLFRGSDARRYIVIDSDSAKQGKTWRGIPIVSPDAVTELDWDSACLLVSTHGSQAAVVDAAKKRGIPETAIVTLYDEVRRY